MKAKILITISLEILTDKNDEEIKNAIKKGIYRGLDTEPNYIAQPTDVNINEIDIKPL